MDKKIKAGLINNDFVTRKGKILAINTNKHGYCYVSLTNNFKVKYMLVHRLVAIAFIKNPNNYFYINHKDENKQNNNVDNLEWCTLKYNNIYGNRLQNCSSSVIQIKNNKKINVFSSMNEAERMTNIKAQNISACCRGKRKTAGGFKWRYANDKNYSWK